MGSSLKSRAFVEGPAQGPLWGLPTGSRPLHSKHYCDWALSASNCILDGSAVTSRVTARRRGLKGMSLNVLEGISV